jgi:two-component system chemotaxis response regulator CheB
MKIRVLVVDDSPLIRAVLREAFERTSDIEVVAEAGDGRRAIDEVLRVRPDIVTMDVLMPSMDGLAATQTIMHVQPTPIVIIARDGGDGRALAIEALGRGALAVFPKPSAGFDQAAARELAEIIRRLAREAAFRANGRADKTAPPRRTKSSVEAVPTAHLSGVSRTEAKQGAPPAHSVALAIAGVVGSTGAPRILRDTLAGLPPNFSLPIVVVQHTERGYAQSLCSWLGETSALPVRLGRDGHVLLPGEVVVAPDDVHMEVHTGGMVALQSGLPVDGFRPSATILLSSLAASFGQRALGVVLSGMGNDGAAGLRALVAAGGCAVVEDPRTAAVPGMPRRALEESPAASVQAGAGLATLLLQLVESGRSSMVKSRT